MHYSVLVETYQKIEGTSKRLEINDLLVSLLKSTPADIIDKVIYLTQGKLYPDYFGIELGVAEKLAIRSIAVATGVGESEVLRQYQMKGDLGDAARDLLAGKQQTPLAAAKLTVENVYNTFDKIARASGTGSTESKIGQLTGLVSKASPGESKYLARMAVGKLRLGVADMTILDSLAVAMTGAKDMRPVLERAYNLSSDLGYVAKTLAVHGPESIENFTVTVGRPIRPMLAERLSDPREILEKMQGEAAAEYKYDGLRIQAHLSKNGPKLYSRRLEDITSQFPDVQEVLRHGIKHECIVEGEAVPVDPSTGELLPFQLISQRRGRKYDLTRMVEEIPVATFLFDALYLDGSDLTRRTYPERRKALTSIVKPSERLALSAQAIVKLPAQLDDFMVQAVANGCEGLMIKSVGPESLYNAGARGWNWIKYKRDYKSEMQDTVDLVVVGAFPGRGRRGGKYGAVLLATYDEKSDVFRTVCKCGSGFKDADLARLPDMMEKYRTRNKDPRVESKIEADVWFVPGLVIEVTGSEITLSPIHTCGAGLLGTGTGLAIRFPRFTGRYRDDKSPEQATSDAEIANMYKSQQKRKVGR